ncbi:hypothetical protein GCM10009555_023100 [Acrocarpospora macrocephala]|uniref:Fido domain-containing protein n=1 Tax=Acrocarpospora macrocephala TaxID=150177 RepID=A0A5M3WVI8_9ACTN|nr:Fic family protein [Acrocarpospora macrocephala]GES12242.1 hypothetical protein Amac_058390 [Acrocarpospora macrocephala]
MAGPVAIDVVHGVWSDGREYAALIPPPIATADVCGGFDAAEEAARECDAILARHRRGEQLVTSLLHAESLPSPQVNALAVGRQVRLGRDPHRAMAAFRRAVTVGAAAPAVELDWLTGLHATLVPGLGGLRERLVWLCAAAPADAVFVGPPHELVPELIADLLAYLRRDDVSPLEQAAVGYAQLEFIHPFVDGNGRLGRCLMQVIPQRRGLVTSLAPPLGLLFAANMPRFLEAHRRFREGDRAFWCRYVAELAVMSAANVQVLLGRSGRKERTHGSTK